MIQYNAIMRERKHKELQGVPVHDTEMHTVFPNIVMLDGVSSK